MNREEKRQRRIEAFKARAEKARNESTAAYNRSNSYVAGIPAGQPILVGHYSEKRHRNALDKSWNALGQSVKLGEKADYYEQKAVAAENNTNIYLEDDDSVQRLEEKIKDLKESQEKMKAINKVCKSKKLTSEQKKERLQKEFSLKEKTIESLLTEDYRGLGYPSYMLTNNNANIKQAEKQLQKAIFLKNTESKEYEINGITIKENTDDNRVQIFFEGKPDEETRKTLKRSGFRWSPSNLAWQTYLNRWNIEKAKEIAAKV